VSAAHAQLSIDRVHCLAVQEVGGMAYTLLVSERSNPIYSSINRLASSCLVLAHCACTPGFEAWVGWDVHEPA